MNPLIAGYSQILGDCLELINRCAGLRALRIDNVVQTMIQVVIDEGLLGLAHCALCGVELLRDVQARPSRFDHFRNAAQLALGSLESLEDFRMGLMKVR
jgi:hypothetical protein